MRRVITFALVMAFTYALLGAFAPAQPRPGAAAAHLTAQAGRSGFKVVRFAGYTIRVPASWPVYRLDRDSTRCVRYDRHAVYLGQPGANQQCPAHLVGHTATISIQASGPPRGPVSTVGPEIGTLPQVRGAVTRDAQEQQLRTSLADPGVSVTGTYTGDGRGMLSIIRTLRRAGGHLTGTGAGPGHARAQVMTRSAAGLPSAAQRAATAPRAAATLRTTHPGQRRPARGHHRQARGHHRQARRHQRSSHQRARHQRSSHQRSKHERGKRKAARHHTRRQARKHQASRHRAIKHRARSHRARTHHARKHRARPHQRARSRAHPSPPALRQALHGFDSCTTPSPAAMRAWRRTFSAMAVYIGGVEAGCASPNLTADWVHAVTGMGWALIPTYVGRQASCSSFSVRIRPARAVAQGQAAARDAMQQAAALGMGRGTPVYYDMEAYHGYKRCKDATLAFLDAWTRTLHAQGYSSGVYSSASSAAENLGWARTVNGHAIAEPDSMWFGLWDNQQNVRGLPYLLESWWRGPRRIKQYEGPHKRTVGGYTLDIDSDWVYGAVYR